jgi:hypothetical protein
MADKQIAALYVQTDGAYYGIDGVDPWDEHRDARMYHGPDPVVAHPPCKRWGRYWSGGPSARVRRRLGDDNGCFAAALLAVRTWGGVLEHPEASHAWRVYGITRPPRGGGWVQALDVGWTCCVEQGHYGHLARKATWLLVCGTTDAPPDLKWGPSSGERLDAGFHSRAEREAYTGPPIRRLTPSQNLATPPEFRDALIDIARRCRRG